MGLGLKEAWSSSLVSYPALVGLPPPMLSLSGATLVLPSDLHTSQLASLEHDTATTYSQHCPAPQVSTLRPPFHSLQEAFPDHPAVQATCPLLVHPAHPPSIALCPLDDCHVLTHCHPIRQRVIHPHMLPEPSGPDRSEQAKESLPATRPGTTPLALGGTLGASSRAGEELSLSGCVSHWPSRACQDLGAESPGRVPDSGRAAGRLRRTRSFLTLRPYRSQPGVTSRGLSCFMWAHVASE